MDFVLFAGVFPRLHGRVTDWRGNDDGDGDPLAGLSDDEIRRVTSGDYIPPASRLASEPWESLVRVLIGGELERYESVITTVPWFRLASWGEDRLTERAEQLRKIAELNA